ncbi:MAG: nucleotidyltransferase substrate binding protein [Bacteroidales bacterium]|nr:nucleotidyltransferase substrate binding protein [Bacteroidales bacterium]
MNKFNDIRWIQRFSNYKKALDQLREFVMLKELSKFEKQGLIKSFEYTYELGWNTIKDYLYYQGNPDVSGSRDTIREGFKQNLISDGDGWMEMLQSRNRTSHTYDEDTAEEIVSQILTKYFHLFEELLETFSNKK